MNKTKLILSEIGSGKADANETKNISAFIDSEMGIILDEALLRAKLKKSQKFQERSQNSK